MTTNKRLMVIDAFNAFIKSFIVSPEISINNGQPIGGLSGFLKSLQKQIREIKPDQIIIVFDGPGGSARKRSILKDYKEGRKPLKLNRNIEVLSNEENTENKNWQIFRLMEMLNQFPLIQLVESDVEA